jgi:SAM-dependent methyltransferase
MRTEAFNLLLAAEKSWWYRTRIAIVKKVITRFHKVPLQARVLDAGAGYGGMREVFGRQEVIAYEPVAAVGAHCLERGYSSVLTSIDELGIGDHAQQFSLIGSFDVLEHIEDDVHFLGALAQHLVKGGGFVATVPAFMWLWSEHDVEHQHFRRYNARTLERLFKECGFQIKYLGYWNATLFLPAALMRLMGRSGGSALEMPWFVNAVIEKLFMLERFVIPYVRLPFGTSLIIYAEKIS